MTQARASAKTEALPTLTARSDIEAIVAGPHGNPFAVLGIQAVGKGFVARCFIPHADHVSAFTLDGAAAGELRRIDDAGFFEGVLSLEQRQPIRYHARNAGGSISLAPTSSRMRAPSVSVSRSGPRTPAASRWSAISTIGTAAAIR